LGGATKATLTVGGLTLLERVRAALVPQARTVLLSVATHHFDEAWADTSGLPLVSDPIANTGPMGGIAGALVWARTYAPDAAAVVSVPVDVPFIPADLIARLTKEDGVAVAVSGELQHPAIAAWPLAVADDLLASVARGEVALHRWQEKHPLRRVPWHTQPYDPFLNINTAEDLQAAEAVAALAAGLSPRSPA
jgi:molybdopterin-guanine dinucleotide biosynthesis protein A